MMSNVTPSDSAVEYHEASPDSDVEAARWSTIFAAESAACTPEIPAFSSPASCAKLDVDPSGHSIPPLISLPTCTRAGGVPCLTRSPTTCLEYADTCDSRAVN